MDPSEFNKFINHLVLVDVRDGDGTVNQLSGKVSNVSSTGIVLSSKSTSRIINAPDIENIRIKRGRVVSRVVRVFTDKDDVRQHLADRHGIFVSVLRMASSDTAHRMHQKIDHKDLGHQHGDKPGTQVVDKNRANEMMDELDEIED